MYTWGYKSGNKIPTGQQFSVKPISLVNAGQGSAFLALLNASNAIEQSEKGPAYRDRRGFLTPLDGHMLDISPRIADFFLL